MIKVTRGTGISWKVWACVEEYDIDHEVQWSETHLFFVFPDPHDEMCVRLRVDLNEL